MVDATRSRNRGRTAPIAVALSLSLAVAAAVLAGDPGAAEGASNRPNIVVISTDDQPFTSMRYMPRTRKLISGRGRGTRFNNAIATTPLCCPSRASLITGQYGHNNGVLRNDYALLRNKRAVLPMWLQRSGYVTAHVGKFLNRYGRYLAKRGRSTLAPAPGWTHWVTQVGARRYYDYKLSVDGRSRHFGKRPRNHLTSVVTRRAAALAERFARRSKPLYLQVDYYAPHRTPGDRSSSRRCPDGPVPRPADTGKYAGEPLPQDAAGIPNAAQSFNERDISDKPAFFQNRYPKRLSRSARRQVKRRWICAIESLRGVDVGVRRIWQAVKAVGELNKTVFIFTSDNGFFHGEHRIPKEKLYPYEENLRVPLLISAPRSVLGSTPTPSTAALAANIDLAPTILDFARARPCAAGSCRTMDGRSLGPAMAGSGHGGRTLVIERGWSGDCRYRFRGLRTADEVYVRWLRSAGGGCADHGLEHYDLAADPRQLENLAPAPSGSPEAARQRSFERELADLENCAGIAGRDPNPAPRSYCE